MTRLLALLGVRRSVLPRRGLCAPGANSGYTRQMTCLPVRRRSGVAIVPRSTEQLRHHALQIWQAGLDAVRSDRLIAQAMRVEGEALVVGDQVVDLRTVQRIVVVGAGKAGAGMAEAVERVLGPRLLAEKQLAGWVNVPDDCVRTLERIHLHPARPAGSNEPTAAGVRGAGEILQRVRSLTDRDLCLCLISGGGSALLPAPAEGITLADKLAVTQHLSGAGANIRQLNVVRKQLSRVKGGGLLRACGPGRLITLIISDVLGDPLDVIASGPTVEDRTTPEDALEVLEHFGGRLAGISQRVFDYLRQKRVRDEHRPACRASHCVIGNNATAVEAAGRAASQLGYTPRTDSSPESEGLAEQVGRRLADGSLGMQQGCGPDCWVSGGEPVVKLVGVAERGAGGRNQQLVLAALERLEELRAAGIALLSGGTDGEDGPTDAAGALLDDQVRAAAHQRGLVPRDYLRRNDAYHFFQPLEALIKTGPTHTNVCDLRVAIVERVEQRGLAGADIWNGADDCWWP